MGKKNMIKTAQALRESFKKREGMSFTFFLQKSFPAFEGHFPGMPVLPAIVQLEMALFCIRILLDKNVSLSEIKRSKFAKPVLPETEIAVEINENGGGCFNVVIRDEKEVYSQIQLEVS